MRPRQGALHVMRFPTQCSRIARHTYTAALYTRAEHLSDGHLAATPARCYLSAQRASALNRFPACSFHLPPGSASQRTVGRPDERQDAMAHKGDKFHPGEKVPSSGIYSVIHNGHAADHEVTCIKGKKFPPCADCGDGVEFVLKRKAKHVTDHRLFEGQ